MLGDGKKTYIIGKSEDIDAYLKINTEFLYNPHSRDRLFFMNADDYGLGPNRAWIRQAAHDVRSGIARIMMVSINDCPERVFAQEIQWLEELGLEYCAWESSFVPKGAAKGPDWVPPRARL